MPVADISLSDVSIAMAAEAEAAYPEMADDLEQMRRAGFFVRNARGLRLHNVAVRGQIGAALHGLARLGKRRMPAGCFGADAHRTPLCMADPPRWSRRVREEARITSRSAPYGRR